MKQLKHEILHDFANLTAGEIKLGVCMVLVGLLVMFGDILQAMI